MLDAELKKCSRFSIRSWKNVCQKVRREKIYKRNDKSSVSVHSNWVQKETRSLLKNHANHNHRQLIDSATVIKEPLSCLLNSFIQVRRFLSFETSQCYRDLKDGDVEDPSNY